MAIVTAEAQAVRWRDDGTNPTATVGYPLSTSVELVIKGAAQLAAIKFIQQSATANLNISYYA
jgi:hypothetical protein